VHAPLRGTGFEPVLKPNVRARGLKTGATDRAWVRFAKSAKHREILGHSGTFWDTDKRNRGDAENERGAEECWSSMNI